MVQVDLITGFLGAGKTTFLRRYVRYLVEQGHNVCILENDFGAVNVDAMLVQDLLGDRCDLETISGGCDCDTHQRRMRTKLIAMAMRGFDRVVVEPSGIFDVDEFFDVLRDDPLDRWYRIGNVIAIVDAMLPEALSPQAEYLLASETANAGRVLLSRAPQAGPEQCRAAIAHLDRALEACKCSRRFAPHEILTRDWAALTDADLAQIAACGMRQASCEKLHFDEHKGLRLPVLSGTAPHGGATAAGSCPAVRGPGLRAGAAGQGVCPHAGRLAGAERHRRRADTGPHPAGAGCAHRHRRGAGQGKNRNAASPLSFNERCKTGAKKENRIMKKNPQMPSARRILGMVVGIVIIGLGIALFKQSHLGNDSISALNMRLAEMLGISLGVQNLCTNILFFALQFWFGRKYIGLGTFVNGICIGYIVTAFYDPIHAHFGDAPSLAVQLAWVIAAVLVTALGASLYQTADLGIAPYDYLSLGLRDYTPCPYFGCRIFTDALSALLCWLLGGLVGLGTLICAFCLGPFIQFFDRTFSQKVLQYKPNN